jgi:hypothetical protein
MLTDAGRYREYTGVWRHGQLEADIWARNQGILRYGVMGNGANRD